MSLHLEKLSGLSDRHTLKIQRPWFSSDGQREVTLGTLAEYFGENSPVAQALQDHIDDPTAAHAASAISFAPGGGISATTTQGALVELGTSTAATVIASKVGDRLIASLQAVWPSNAGTAHFATTRTTAGTFTVRTSTGYARLINADGSLGAQAGTGVAGSNITLTIPAAGGIRALGVLSVANGGSTRSGNITYLNLDENQLTSFSGTGLSALTYLYLSYNQLTSFSGTGLSSLTTLNLDENQLTSFSGTGLSALTYLYLSYNQLTSFSGTGLSSLTELNLGYNQLTSFSGTGLSALTTLNLGYNQLTSFSGTGLSALTELNLTGNQLTSFSSTGLSSLTTLNLSYNQLTSTGQDDAFNSLPVDADDNAGYWESQDNLGAPTAASQTKRDDMTSGGWTLVF